MSGLPGIENPTKVCERCLVGMQTRNPFPTKTQYRALDKLEFVHGDLYSPFLPPTPSCNNYFLFLVDDFPRVMWVYLLKTKDEAFATFKGFSYRSRVSSYQTNSVPIALKQV